jgi:acetyl-CoA acetyltransferase
VVLLSISGIGKLPFNTDGAGLCNNHPANRGSITKVLEAVRQLRGEAHPAVQVKNRDLALATLPRRSPPRRARLSSTQRAKAAS